ncbi:acid phosphatase [Klebsiella pneumoniae]|uniref:Acid phosphatase n=1 Tax=Klebsiella pneumoniae TaxID=573 RepID=A0A377TSI9_KLEPN|nr:acid phosphatase [Klebsiella pneumoniae]
MYEQGRLLRNTERGKLAAEDANLSAGGVANAFSSAFGSPITEKDAPQLHKLLTNMIEDAGDLATRSAKEKYMRIRRLRSMASPPATPPNRTSWRKTALTLRAYFYRLGHRPGAGGDQPAAAKRNFEARL